MMQSRRALLQSMGYAQTLAPHGRFSNFAISFSINCILAGEYVLQSHQPRWGSGCRVLWPIGVGFSLLVALCMARLPRVSHTAAGLSLELDPRGAAGLGYALVQPQRLIS